MVLLKRRSTHILSVLGLSAALGGAALAAHMDTMGVAPAKPSTEPFSDPTHFQEAGGAAIYGSVCAGCHMPEGRGAVGAGAYPVLARNPKLEAAGYPVGMVLHGQNAMPPFGPYFTDQQVADVVNYVRTHFGNDYKDKVMPDDVKVSR